MAYLKALYVAKEVPIARMEDAFLTISTLFRSKSAFAVCALRNVI